MTITNAESPTPTTKLALTPANDTRASTTKMAPTTMSALWSSEWELVP